MVKAKVLVGTLSFEHGVFQKGSVIDVDKETLKRLGRDVEPVQETPAEERSAETQPQETPPQGRRN